MTKLNHTCHSCDTEYTVKFEDTPLFNCHSCNLPSHDCEGIQKIKSFFPDELSVGFAWLCGACYKFPSDSTNLLQSVSNNANATDDVEAEIKDEPVQKPNKIPNNDKKSTSETAVSANSPASTVPLCKRYRCGICPHGGSGKVSVNGKICAYAHPPKCRKYLISGTKGKYGCWKGDKCKFFHPILCSSSNSDDKICTRESCKLQHLRGTKRTTVPASQGAQGPQTNKHEYSGGGTTHAAASTNRIARVAASAPSKNEDLEEIRNW